MLKEIGGYIEFEHYSGNQFHNNAIKLNCARNCLAYLIKACNIKKIYIPYFLCDSIWKTCKNYGVIFQFYNINEQFLPIIPDGNFTEDWLYVVNYYGQISNKEISKLKQITNNLIIDNVQSFFQMPVPNVKTLYSNRKYFGVTDGAYLYTDNLLNESIETDISYKRFNFLLGRFEQNASDFYKDYVNNNILFENEPIKKMSFLTENIMRSIDYNYIAKIRTDNFNYLHKKLKNKNKLKLKIPFGAFSYPLLINNGEMLRKKLINSKIYIPTLWPDVLELCEKDSLEYNYAQNILPIPIDQRYNDKDMDYIISKIFDGEMYE